MPDPHLDLSHRLCAAHLAALRSGSAISDEVIAARGYRTIADRAELAALDFKPAQCRVPGLLLPLWAPDAVGAAPALYVYRPDAPRSYDEKGKGRLPDGTYPQRVVKYEIPKDVAMRLDCPPSCRPTLRDPILASRTIVVPLIRTPDRQRANADPLDASLWPCDRRKLPPKPSPVTSGDSGGRPAAAFSPSRAWPAGLSTIYGPWRWRICPSCRPTRRAWAKHRSSSGGTWSRSEQSWRWRCGWTTRA